MNLENLPELCSEKDIAQFLHLSAYTIRDMCIKGELPHRRIRKHYRIMKQDLIDYLEASKCQRKTEEKPLSGDLSATYGRSSGSTREKGNGDQQALMTARKLIKRSQNIRKEQDAGRLQD